MQFASVFLIWNFISVYTTAGADYIQPNFALQVWIRVKGAPEYESVGFVKIDSSGALILGESSDPAAFYMDKDELRLIGGGRLVGDGKNSKLQLGGEGKVQWTKSTKDLGAGRVSIIYTPGTNLEIRGCFQGKTSLDMPFYLKAKNDHTRCSIQFYFEER